VVDAAVALQALADSRSAVQKYLAEVETVEVRLSQAIRSVETHVDKEIHERVRQREVAEAELRSCQAQEDANCAAEAAAFRRACERLERAQVARAKLIDAIGGFTPARQRFMDVVRSTVPDAVEFLNVRSRAIEEFAQQSGSSALGAMPAAAGIPSGGRPGSSGNLAGAGIPKGYALVPLDLIDDAGSAVAGPGDFAKGYSPQDLEWAYRAFDEVVLPALQRGLGSDYFHDRDLREGRQGTRSYSDTFSGFFGDSAIKLDARSDGRFEVSNGYHRIWVARQCGRSAVPARIS
jgi:hypothetical protein